MQQGQICIELILHKNRGLLIALQFGGPGAPYLPRNRGAKITHSGKKMPRVVNTSKSAPQVNIEDIAKRLGGQRISELPFVEHFSVAGDSLTLTLQSGIRFQLKEEGYLSFITEDNRQLVFKDDEARKVYIVNSKGESQTLWENKNA